jgi:hypothetical protein
VVQEFGRRFIAELRLTHREQDAAIAYDMTTPMWSGHAEYILTATPASKLDQLRPAAIAAYVRKLSKREISAPLDREIRMCVLVQDHQLVEFC